MTMTQSKGKGGNGNQGQQVPPGAYFRVPGIGARPRFVEEVGPCANQTTVTLAQGNNVSANFQKFQTLDIDRAFLLELAWSTTFTEGNGKTITGSTLFPANNVSLIQVQFESAYSTFRLPGWLAFVMQSYRSTFAPTSRDTSSKQAGSNPFPGQTLGSTMYASAANQQLGTPTLAQTFLGSQQTYNTFIEVPVSMYFDLYYELATNGQPMGMPIPRAIVSPQRMAATTRNVIPKVTYAQLFATADTYDAPAAIASTDATSTAAGTVVESWWRDAWIPTDNMVTEPPGRMWQYTRDFITFQPSGARIPIIPLDDEVPGQGQILSMVFGCWDPTLNGSNGQMVPFSDYVTVELLLGSSIQLQQDTPASNQYKWLMQHNAVLPAGLMGWDLALTEDGKLTNENAINTLVQNGAQIRVTFQNSFTPGAGATIYVGLEVLKKVGS
jgi:hypothetical protein